MLETLPWDSQFFGKKIGKCTINEADTESLISILTQAKAQQFSLIYLFCPASVLIDIPSLAPLKIWHVDLRVVFQLYNTFSTITNNSAAIVPIQPFNIKSHASSNQLYMLAFESGEYSRFRKDSNFSKNDFERLYKQWIDNACDEDAIERLFVYKIQNDIAGFITVKVVDNVGIIGLLSVSKQHQRKGVGLALINFVKAYLLKRNIHILRVATQKANVNACAFYIKCGFEILDQTNVYHAWL